MHGGQEGRVRRLLARLQRGGQTRSGMYEELDGPFGFENCPDGAGIVLINGEPMEATSQLVAQTPADSVVQIPVRPELPDSSIAEISELPVTDARPKSR